jgi:hypothetical protein
VTFDRHLSAKPYHPGETISIPKDCCPTPDYDAVVMELKFTDRFPGWMHDLVRVFNLSPVSFPKYIHCSDAIVDRDRHAKSVANGRAGGRVGMLR